MLLVTFPIYLFSEEAGIIRVFMLFERDDIDHIVEYWVHKVAGLSPDLPLAWNQLLQAGLH